MFTLGAILGGKSIWRNFSNQVGGIRGTISAIYDLIRLLLGDYAKILNL